MIGGTLQTVSTLSEFYIDNKDLFSRDGKTVI